MFISKLALEHLSDTFRLLSQCFQYPRKPVVTYLSQSLLGELAWHLQNLPSSPRLNNSLVELEDSIRSHLSSVSLEDWQVEYTGLFIYAASAIMKDLAMSHHMTSTQADISR
jgi:nitrate reductase assembly molybdenum cofactor insertion protein NarJ